MKTIIVSDLHLTDIFEPRKYAFLKRLFSSCDQLIINGDFWCGFSTTFEKFINSKWNILFPLMLQKHTIYISGNHDHQEFFDHRFELFADQIAKTVNLKNNTSEFVIAHGHEYIRPTRPKHLNLKKILKIQKFKKIYYSLLNRLLLTTHVPIIFSPIFRLYNRYVYTKAKKLLQTNSIIVTGHTHLPEFRPHRGYINTGYVMSGFAWHLEITPNSCSLQKSRY